MSRRVVKLGEYFEPAVAEARHQQTVPDAVAGKPSWRPGLVETYWLQTRKIGLLCLRLMYLMSSLGGSLRWFTRCISHRDQPPPGRGHSVCPLYVPVYQSHTNVIDEPRISIPRQGQFAFPRLC